MPNVVAEGQRHVVPSGKGSKSLIGFMQEVVPHCIMLLCAKALPSGRRAIAAERIVYQSVRSLCWVRGGDIL